MNLHDLNFLSFDGEPVTGRVPPRLEVVGNDGVLTPQQQAGVAHAYKLFCDVKRVSLGNYLTQHRTLVDGTQVTMTSLHGLQMPDLDSVRVNPPPAGGEPLVLKDLFFALPGYGDNVGYPPYDPKFSATWAFRGKTAVPTSLHPARLQEDAAGLQQHPGNLTWWSDSCKIKNEAMVLSWYGRATRYGRFDYFGRQRQLCVGVIEFQRLYNHLDSRADWKDAFKPAVWLCGVKHAVNIVVADVPTDLPVMSAGLKKEAAGLFLYLVSYKSSNRLAVYKGHIKPLTGKTVTAEELFEIDFQVESTTYAAAHSTNPQWEALLQPLYFNGSCTACAGLVSVWGQSTVNTAGAATTDGRDAFFVRLLQVDIEAQTTAVTGSDASFEQSGTGPIVNTFISYAAVDYVEDQLLVAMVNFHFSLTITFTGTPYIADPGAGLLGNHDAHEMTQTVNTSYRVYFLHDNFTLAQKSSGPVYVGDINTTAAEETFPGQPNGTAVRREYVSALLYLLGCSVAGGDLRHRAPVVFEAIEIGNSQWEANLTYHDLMTLVSYTINARQRKWSGRFSVWKDGAEVETGPYWDNTATGGLSQYGLATDFIGEFPHGGTFIDFSAFAYSEFMPISLPGFDVLSDFRTAGNPFHDTGWAYVNTSAFSPDGAFWFYDIGPFFANASFTWGTAFSSLFGMPAQNPVSAFVINGAELTMDMTAIVPTGLDPAFSSPVFINRVPNRLAL